MFLASPAGSGLRRRRAVPPLFALGAFFGLGLALGCAVSGGGLLSWRAIPRPPPAVAEATVPWRRGGEVQARHPVEILRVIDGDTFEARVHLWPGLDLVTRVRLRGIDAAERKAACAGELRMADAATEALRALLAEGGVAIFDIGPDKYHGRVVADAATRATPSVSEAMLASGLVRRYGGGRRQGWC